MFTVYMFPFTPQSMTNLGIPLNIPNHYTVILRKTMGEVIISTFESQKMNVLECASQSISQRTLNHQNLNSPNMFFPTSKFISIGKSLLSHNKFCRNSRKNSFSFSVNCSWRISVSGNMLQWSSRSNKLRQGRALMWSQTCVNSIIHQFSLGCLKCWGDGIKLSPLVVILVRLNHQPLSLHLPGVQERVSRF